VPARAQDAGGIGGLQAPNKLNLYFIIMHYVKIFNKNLKHNEFTYKEGLNIDHIPFNPTGTCKEGGLYFCEANDVHLYLNYGTLMADVEIPPGAQVYHGSNKLKADKIIITNIRPIEDHILWSDPDFCRIVVTHDSFALRFVKEQTDELCNLAVPKTGEALLTDELCKIAVTKDGLELRYWLLETMVMHSNM
jgi:hypothetical protein